MSSSTSSSDLCWRRFTASIVRTALTGLGLIYVFVAVIDPHDNLFISPDWERAVINTNQRFSYPAIARNPDFDSAVFGTSTSRLLKPSALERHLGGRFANLAMNSATAYEQSRMFELFMRHHSDPATLVIGVDIVWCRVSTSVTRYTFRPFPEWMYDENRWNDLLHLLNGPAVEQAGRQLEYWLGRREPKYGFDGYKSFLPLRQEYDIEKARAKIYGPRGPRLKPTGSAIAQSDWTFATHELLAGMLAMPPDETTKILFLVPYHDFNQPDPSTLRGLVWNVCKRRLGELATATPNTHVLDFMISSPITTQDENYWDLLHYSEEVGERIPRLMARALAERTDLPELHYLGSARPAGENVSRYQ